MSGRPAALTRELRAPIIDISESGCLIEIRRRLEVGTVGTLRLRFGAEEYRDDVELVRCEAVERERSLYRTAVRFLWTRRAMRDRSVTRLQVMPRSRERQGAVVVM